MKVIGINFKSIKYQFNRKLKASFSIASLFPSTREIDEIVKSVRRS